MDTGAILTLVGIIVGVLLTAGSVLVMGGRILGRMDAQDATLASIRAWQDHRDGQISGLSNRVSRIEGKLAAGGVCVRPDDDGA